MKKLLILLIAIIFLSCVPITEEDKKGLQIPVGQIRSVYSTTKYDIYHKEIATFGGYRTDIVWAEDKDGNLLQLTSAKH